ncbi:zinc finger protein 239-like [Engraulis encrasicolus]|uniref:zinc finger protein 239-like n=1 Tax=Engraulis encrasicolus TaxID=184585 RepID=UPI002FD76B53
MQTPVVSVHAGLKSNVGSVLPYVADCSSEHPASMKEFEIKDVLRHIGANHKQTCPELEKVKECITEALQLLMQHRDSVIEIAGALEYITLRKAVDVQVCFHLQRANQFITDAIQAGHIRRRQRIHTRERPYQCQQCGKSFSQAANLHQHQQQQHMHVGDKPLDCHLCGKTLPQAGHLGGHQCTLPVGDKPYHCILCGKSFSKAGNLRAHQRTHTGEKPYCCAQCGKRFSKAGNLKAHQHIHTGVRPFGCPQCGKSFSKAGNLKAHQRIHTGDKPYGCGQCGKSFSRAGTLQHHQLIHTGEKPYNCSQCGKHFSQAGNLKHHLDRRCCVAEDSQFMIRTPEAQQRFKSAPNIFEYLSQKMTMPPPENAHSLSNV